ncbi:MAG: type II secretion system F family protein, partial [Kineosporiaceae bacterium]
AGLPLRTGEWVLLHLGSGLLGNLLFVLLGRGQPVAAVLGLLLGLIGPWMFLGLRRDRRQRQFLTQLPDTLQLIAGSLQAGHSLPQAIDAVVRDGAPPISTELQRAVVENQLGLPLVSALDGVATRLSSRDFAWVVMAIRIQGEVGGNLAELLGTVSGTLRERERLRRQVQALSAEGRMSGWILGALPVVFATYLPPGLPEPAVHHPGRLGHDRAGRPPPRRRRLLGLPGDQGGGVR